MIVVAKCVCVCVCVRMCVFVLRGYVCGQDKEPYIHKPHHQRKILVSPKNEVSNSENTPSKQTKS